LHFGRPDKEQLELQPLDIEATSSEIQFQHAEFVKNSTWVDLPDREQLELQPVDIEATSQFQLGDFVKNNTWVHLPNPEQVQPTDIEVRSSLHQNTASTC
jgi:hypothetical protein